MYQYKVVKGKVYTVIPYQQLPTYTYIKYIRT